MISLTSPAAVFLLAAMVALGPLATSMYLPAFPAMAQAFDVGADKIQLTLSAYMIGLAVAQLVYGPLADRFGRRPVLLGGLTLFSLGSIGCMSAESINTLLGYRFAQAFGAAAGMVLAQAVVRDTFEPLDAARRLGYMASTTALAPALAPVAGGVLLVQFGWPSIFLVLTIIAALVLIAVGCLLPESLPRNRRQTLHPLTVLRNYAAVTKSCTFLGHGLAMSLMFAGHYGFISGAPFVLINIFGVPEHQFGWYFMFVVGAFIVSSLVGAKLGHHFGSRCLILAGGTLLASAGILMATLVLVGTGSAVAVIGPQVIYALGAGLMMPQLIAGALMPFQRMAGTAAATLGFSQMSAAAAASALVGKLHDGTALPMTLTIAFAGIGTIVIYLALIPKPAANSA